MFNIRHRLGGYPVLSTSITVLDASIDKAIYSGKEIYPQEEESSSRLGGDG